MLCLQAQGILVYELHQRGRASSSDDEKVFPPVYDIRSLSTTTKTTTARRMKTLQTNLSIWLRTFLSSPSMMNHHQKLAIVQTLRELIPIATVIASWKLFEIRPRPTTSQLASATGISTWPTRSLVSSLKPFAQVPIAEV